MSANTEEEKDVLKALPLDLARTQLTTVRTVESSKAPLVMTSQALRSVRVLAQGVPTNTNPSSVGQTIITSLVPQAVIKADSGRGQISGIVGSSQGQNPPQASGSISLQRPAQITLSSTPLITQNPAGTTYHVPRGPAVVANLAAPRSNVTTVRTPLVVTAQNNQTHTFVRPPRTPSPAQGTAWLTANNSNVSQIKGAPTVLSSPIRGASVTGKIATTGRLQTNQPIPTIRSGALLSNAISIGQTIHQFKPAPGTSIQQIPSGVTIAQMLSNRPQAVVYSANTSAQFTPTARITVTTTVQSQVRPVQARPLGPVVTGTRLTVPISHVQGQTARMVAPSQSVAINASSRLAASQQQPVLTTTRIVTTQATNVGRLSVTPSTISSSANATSNILTSQARISTFSALNLQSLMAVTNGGPARVQSSQGPKVITQPAQATIHLTQIPSQIKTTTSNMGTPAARTINVPASIVAQRPNSVGSPQTISIAKVFPSNDNQGNAGDAGVYIHAPLQTQLQRHASPSPGVAGTPSQQVVTSVPTTTGGTSFSLANQESSTGYFYENATTGAQGASVYQRAFVTQSGAFVPQAQQQPQQQLIRPPVTVSSQQLHGMRFSSVVVVEPNRSQPQTSQFQSVVAQSQIEHHQMTIDGAQHHQQTVQAKVNSSPRPSILRKRDHEGSPLKAAKNLTPALQSLTVQTAQAHSPPPSPSRPDSRGNGHSSGGSTTISATSSPGLVEINEDSNPPVPMNIKEEEEEETKPPMEMSPRKKPRKQQLTNNEIEENHDDMQFISESSVAKKESYDSDGQKSDSSRKDGAPEAGRITTLRKPATASLLNGYRQTWKATHNHYQRYSDVKPKEERRTTIIDLANQHRVLEKINGWKVYHLSTQMEDLAGQEQSVYDQLTEILKFTESQDKHYESEVNRVSELIKGNLQRIKIINDGMLEAKCQIMKVFDHQRHVNDILSRCVSKRNFKKREKS